MGYTVSTVKKYIGSLSGGEEIPSLTEALEQLSAANVRQVIVQPTHLLYGYEYDKLKAEAASLEARFETLTVGRPLLADNRDIQRFAYHLSQDHPARAEGAAVFMGHGTEHFANAVYPALQTALHFFGRNDIYIGTVEGWPGLEEILRQLEPGGARRIDLL